MKRLWVPLLMCLAAGSSSFAQNSSTDSRATRSVEGIVRMSGGSPQADAVVQLKDTKSLQIRSYITLKDGAYHFYGLSGDVLYEVRATFQNSASSTKSISIFDSRKKIVQDLKLK